MISRDMYQEPEGAPIGRIFGQLNGIVKVIYIELELGVRNPEGVRHPEGGWGWLGRKRNDLRTMGRNLTNREIYMYFKDCSIVKSHKLDEAIRKHCLAIDFMGELNRIACDISHGGDFPVS